MGRARSDGCRVVNLKEGMPTVEEARSRLRAVLDGARSGRTRALKLVHGYGASGVGGHIKVAIQRSLRRRRKEGRIRDFVPGEAWHICEAQVQELLEDYPEVGQDSDLNQFNEGITMVFLP